MKCELCGTPVKIVGDTTKHYEPLDMPEMISELICQRSVAFDEAREYREKLEVAVNALKCIGEEEPGALSPAVIARTTLLQITERPYGAERSSRNGD